MYQITVEQLFSRMWLSQIQKVASLFAQALIGGFYEPWAHLLLLCAAGDEPMCIYKRGPHGGLRSCGCREGGAGLGGVVRSLFRGFGLLLLEGIVRAA